jgi:hypothetical protein
MSDQANGRPDFFEYHWREFQSELRSAIAMLERIEQMENVRPDLMAEARAIRHRLDSCEETAHDVRARISGAPQPNRPESVRTFLARNSAGGAE